MNKTFNEDSPRRRNGVGLACAKTLLEDAIGWARPMDRVNKLLQLSYT